MPDIAVFLHTATFKLVLSSQIIIAKIQTPSPPCEAIYLKRKLQAPLLSHTGRIWHKHKQSKVKLTDLVSLLASWWAALLPTGVCHHCWGSAFISLVIDVTSCCPSLCFTLTVAKSGKMQPKVNVCIIYYYCDCCTSVAHHHEHLHVPFCAFHSLCFNHCTALYRIYIYI